MRAVVAGILCVLAVVVPSRSTIAGPNANAKILIDVRQPFPGPTNHVCVNRPPCSQVQTSGGLYPTIYGSVALLVADGDAAAGVAGLQCALKYDGRSGQGVDIFSWVNCASTLLFPPPPGPAWPDSGFYTIITWDTGNNCQQFEPGGAGTGVVTVAGYFYVAAYGADTLAVTPPSTGPARISSCSNVVDEIAPGNLGFAVFSAAGTAPGYAPCDEVIPVEATTWGQIKSLY